MADKLAAHLNDGKRALTAAALGRGDGRSRAVLSADDEADALRLQRGRGRAGDGRGPSPHVAAVREYAATHLGTEAVVVSAAIEVGARGASRGGGARVPGPPRRGGLRRLFAHPRRLPPARAAHLPDRRRKGNARLDHPRRRHGAAGGRRDPHRFRARLHQGGDRRPTRTSSPPARWPRRRRKASSGRRARNTSSQDGDVMLFKFNV